MAYHSWSIGPPRLEASQRPQPLQEKRGLRYNRLPVSDSATVSAGNLNLKRPSRSQTQ